MSNDLVNYLSSTDRHAKLSPEALELMGKQAANMFLDAGLSLNEAVVKLASEHHDINAEQVKRVAEFANTAVYLARHDQSKTAGDASSYPQFELADPARIIQDMSDGARPTIVTKTDLDYSRQPAKKEKVSSDRSFALIAEMFKTKEAASPDFTRETAVEEILAAKHSLIALKENLSNSGEHFDLLHKEASEGYYSSVKNHLLEGGAFADVIPALKTAVGADYPDPVFKTAAAYLEEAIVRLHKDGLSKKVSFTNDEFEKVSHRIVNEEHPMVSAMRQLLVTGSEMDKVAEALKDVNSNLYKVETFIRENFLAPKA